MTDEQSVRATNQLHAADGLGAAYASPKTEAPARMAKNGTAPHRSAAHGAEPGFESE